VTDEYNGKILCYLIQKYAYLPHLDICAHTNERNGRGIYIDVYAIYTVVRLGP